jgi:hypothetical protein
MDTTMTIEQLLVERVVEELIRRLQRPELVLKLFPAEEPEAEEPKSDWPTGVHFEDDPSAIEEPRQAHALPRDLTGFVFGRLEVLERSDVPGYWRVRCSCGIRKEVSREALRTGSARSCGCERLGLGPLQANTVDLMGQRFGKLTVVGRARAQHQITSWRCRCQCGRFAEYRSDMLRAGQRVSCGCVEQAARFAPGRSEAGKATRFQPGSNRPFSFTDALVRDDLLAEFQARGATTDGHWIAFADGARLKPGRAQGADLEAPWRGRADRSGDESARRQDL